MKAQTLQPEHWIVLDNSDSPELGWVQRNGMTFERVEGKRSIGWMRNRCLDLALATNCEFIVFWDDDDYYPPLRIQTGVDALTTSTADIAASSLMYMLLTRENVLMSVGPYGESHGTAATYTVRRAYAEKNRFDERTFGEEVSFTKNWSAKMVQVDAEKTIVVMGHSGNTVNKTEVFENPAKFLGKIMNDINGKQAFRARWPVEWDLWRTTFSVATPRLLQDSA